MEPIPGQDLLNQMWRNACINDTYEPVSTFKIVTMGAALKEGVASLSDDFYCPGCRVVEDRPILSGDAPFGHGSAMEVRGNDGKSSKPLHITQKSL